ncbi:hypothetical protein V2O64_21425 [Verrucomicrobiaceae bacterium 227]
MKKKEKAPELSFQCPKRWENFSGSDTERFCEACGHHVHNLSRLSQSAREDLMVKAREERVCVAYYKNLTGDLLVSSPEDKKKGTAARMAAIAAGAIALSSCASDQHDSSEMTVGMICPPGESK